MDRSLQSLPNYAASGKGKAGRFSATNASPALTVNARLEREAMAPDNATLPTLQARQVMA